MESKVVVNCLCGHPAHTATFTQFGNEEDIYVNLAIIRYGSFKERFIAAIRHIFGIGEIDFEVCIIGKEQIKDLRALFDKADPPKKS